MSSVCQLSIVAAGLHPDDPHDRALALRVFVLRAAPGAGNTTQMWQIS